MSAESGGLLRPAGAVPEGHRDLRAGTLVVCLFVFGLFFSFYNVERIGLQVGANTMDNPLLKYSAKEYFFKASLCHFIVDELNAKVSFFSLFLQFWDEENAVDALLKTPPTLHRSRLKNTRRCSRRSRTPENASC